MHHKTLFLTLADKIKVNCRAKLEFGHGREEEWFTDKSVEFTALCYYWLTCVDDNSDVTSSANPHSLR